MAGPTPMEIPNSSILVPLSTLCSFNAGMTQVNSLPGSSSDRIVNRMRLISHTKFRRNFPPTSYFIVMLVGEKLFFKPQAGSNIVISTFYVWDWLGRILQIRISQGGILVSIFLHSPEDSNVQLTFGCTAHILFFF